MKLSNRRNLFITLAFTLAIGAAGCGGPEAGMKTKETEGPVNLKFAWWGNAQRKEQTLKVIELFQKKYPNIKIQPEDYSGTTALTTQLAMNVADQAIPDLIQMDYSFLNQYSDKKLIAPLDPFVKQGILNLNDVDPAYLDNGRRNDQLLGVTLGLNSPVYAYDPSIFEKAGVPVPKPEYTFDDLYNTARELKAKIKDKDFYPMTGFPDFAYYLRGKGVSYYNKEGTALGYDNDQYFAEFVSMQKKWKEEGLIGTDGSNGNGNNDLLIVQGKAALFHTSSNLVSGISQSAKRPIKILPDPAVPSGQEAKNLKASMLLAVSNFSDHKAEAAKFIDFFINDPETNDILLGERGVPISSKIRERLMGKIKETDKDQYQLVDYLKTHSKPIDPPAPGGSGVVNNLFKIYSEQVMSGMKTPESAAKEFRSEANKALNPLAQEDN
ncbi:ABC transporter substrate-binding protein [Paenibacillus hamazuiensis]|uniref:ABC transporter substrate-binding protein n=1 Tax=Paenibacillus hamazuiensis TaxID=2936508 RepID=UPI00200E7A1E|nr:ABC transporter substrate-binding protein [Paenibacillus hamazuiensis]